jgi:hypothetical protein
MFDAEDVQALVLAAREDGLSITEWCARNDVSKMTFAMLVATFGANPDSSSVAMSCFKLGWEAHEEVEPKGVIHSDENEQFGVQYAIVDMTNGSIAAPLQIDEEWAVELTQVLNSAARALK